VNGVLANLGQIIQTGDYVTVDSEAVPSQPIVPVYILYHKPRGVVTTNAEHVASNLISVLMARGLNCSGHLYAVGRLDKDSEGALLITNQGQLAHGLLHKQAKKNKTYIVTLNQPITYSQIEQLRQGVYLKNQFTLPCQVWRLSDQVLQFVLQQGLNRQIRKMVQTLGLKVVRLQRIEFAELSIQGLNLGEWRSLNPDEIQNLHKGLSISS
jgi:23S rRNA pseudouridine2604 synthase